MHTSLFKKLAASGGGTLKSTLTTSKSNENTKSGANKVHFSTGSITPTESMSVTLDNSTAMDLTPGEAQVSRAEAKREKVVSSKKRGSNTKAHLMYGAGSKSSAGKVGKSAGGSKKKKSKGKKTKQSGTRKQPPKKKPSKAGKKKATAGKTKPKPKPKPKASKSKQKSTAKQSKKGSKNGSKPSKRK